jgi:predicted N-acetyltransferase YhbS
MPPLVRALTPADRAEAKAIWRTRFDDSPAFTDWFFSERFSPETSFCAEENGSIISIAHGSPMRLNVRGVSLPAMMVSGVATLPGNEGRGLMKRVMHALLEHCRGQNIPLAFHTPSHFSIYRAIGEFPCSNARLYKKPSAPAIPVEWDDVPPAEELLEVYRMATSRYSGCVLRDAAQMKRRIRNLLCDGGRYLSLRMDGRMEGYLFASPDEDGLYCEEALCRTPESYPALVSRLPKGTRVKLPPDAMLPGKPYPQGIVVPVDVSYLLKTFCGRPEAFRLRVVDSFLSWNDGLFDGAGSQTDAPPTDTLSIGRLSQFLCGYLPFRDLFGECICFCADEY